MSAGEVSRPEALHFETGEPRTTRVEMADEPVLREDGVVDVLLSDGVRLGIKTRQFGAQNDWPIIGAHGTPGSSEGPWPRSFMLRLNQLRLIAWDRPGYGGTNRHEGRIVADSSTYVEAIAQAYGIPKCSVAGRSGGGASVLASAALSTHLVVNAAVFSSLGPIEVTDNWQSGMNEDNQNAYDPNSDRAQLADRLAQSASAIHTNPYAILDEIRPGMSKADSDYITNQVMRSLIAKSHAEGLRNGHWGRYDDVIAARQPWGFDVRAIQVPVYLAHGGNDSFVPPQHHEWLAQNIPNAQAALYTEMGHMETLDLVLDYFAKLRNHALQAS